jgi:ribA/ribD-fused uncharacterized protein
MKSRVIDEFRGKYFFLSNFYRCSVKYDGNFYPSAEHAFQAAKALSKKDRKLVQFADTAQDAKRLGRTLPLRERWDKIKKDHMLAVLEAKFTDDELAEKLRLTGSATLIEGNTWNDRYWGACRTDPFGGATIWPSQRPGITWHGENHLGILLMQVRENL